VARALLQRGLGVLALVALSACPAFELPTTTSAVVNACTSNAACTARFGAGAVCEGGVCASPGSGAPIVFVVQIATTDPYGGGFTFGFSPKDAPQRPIGCDVEKNYECTIMPLLATAKGLLTVTPRVGKTVSPPRGLLPNIPDPDSSDVSLPAQLRFEPLWVDPSSDPKDPRLLSASTLGLPLPSVGSYLEQTTIPPAPTNGTEVGFGVGFHALVPLSDAIDNRALVRVEVQPITPYEDYPPVVQSLRIGGGPLSYRIDTLSQGGATVMSSTTVKIVAAEAPPRDYRAYLVRASDGVRVSSVAVLAAVPSQDVVLRHVLPGLQGTELVLEPPDGSEGLITQRIAEAGGFAPGIFPAMAPPVTISGKVILQGDLGKPVDADLVFDSKDLVDKNGQSPVASYRRRVRTRLDAGHTGEYTVKLLTGRYDVWAIPQTGSLSALTLKRDFVVSAPQVGAGISIDLRKHLRGRVMLADGTPVADAVVQASATPETYAADPRPVLPRDANATTDASGKFDLVVDPAATYDLTVRTAPGTRLPWVVDTKVLVNDDVDLTSPIVVPAPTVRRGILLDGVGNSMVRTLIRVYAFPDKSTAAPGEVRPARLVAETYTDGVGRYELFLGPLPK
jgi:hypothetical protein